MKTARPLLALMIPFALLAACSYDRGGGSTGQIPAMMSPADMTNQEAAAKNNEGVDHLVQSHYDVSAKHFRDAIAAKPNFAEAHFNLGLALDGMGNHPDATESFKKAKEFGANNPKIAENAILKKHLGM